MSYTINPPAPKPEATSEPTGPIASDSLAAESLSAGGDFNANDPSPTVASSQPGSSSTWANTDTSGASKLPAAVDVEAREATEDWNETSKLKGASGLKYPEGAGKAEFGGTHSLDGAYVGGPTSSGGIGEGQGYRTESSAEQFGGHTSGEDYRAGTAADVAPSYASDLRTEADLKPKGEGLTEGGFDSDAKNASFGNAEIGSKDDPGRVALQGILKADAVPGGAGGTTQRELDTNGVGFDVLKSDESA